MNSPHILVVAGVVGGWLAGWITAVSSIRFDRRHVIAAIRRRWIAAAIVLPVLGPLFWFVVERPPFARKVPVAS